MALADTNTSGKQWVPEVGFGYRLLIIRKTLGLTAAEIADRVGVRQATWSGWETGTTSPRGQADLVNKIATVTGVNREWLMWGESSKSDFMTNPAGQPVLFDWPVAS